MRRLALVFASLLLLATVSCGGDGPTGTGSIEGTYTLRTINGQSLPFTYDQEGNDRWQVVSDRYEILQGGSWTNVYVERAIVGGQTTDQTYTEAGEWELSGNDLVLYTNDGELFEEFTFSGGNQLTVSLPGVTAIYRK